MWRPMLDGVSLAARPASGSWVRVDHPDAEGRIRVGARKDAGARKEPSQKIRAGESNDSSPARTLLLVGGCQCSPAELIFSITLSIPKLPASMRGGYSWKVDRKFATYACAGTSR